MTHLAFSLSMHGRHGYFDKQLSDRLLAYFEGVPAVPKLHSIDHILIRISFNWCHDFNIPFGLRNLLV